MRTNPLDVVIVGAGIGGLTLGLRLHQAGIACRIYEAAPELKPLGVGTFVIMDSTGKPRAIANGATITLR